MSFEIITDSGSNLTEDLLKKYNIHMISYTLEIDGKPFVCYRPGMNYDETAHRFYEDIRAGKNPKSSLLNTEVISTFFRPFLEKGSDIIFVSISSGISGTCNAAAIAATDLAEEFPERNIIVIDSLGASFGSGLFSIMLSDYRSKGLSTEEAAKKIKSSVMNMNQLFTVGDLEYLKRGGRISPAEAALGNLLSIKPILKGNENGQIVVHEKVRSRKKSLEELIRLVCTRITDAPNQVIGISHCDALEEAEFVANRIKEETNVKEMIIRYHDLCTGSHIGPGSIAIFFMGKDRKEF